MFHLPFRICYIFIHESLIYQALSQNSAIQTLGIIPVFDLKTNALKSLDLSGAQVDDCHFMILCSLLKLNMSLRVLHLGGTRMSAAGVDKLALVLKAPTSQLKELHLPATGLRDPMVSALATALKANTSLKLLNLEGNDIRDAGAKALASAVSANTNLISLQLVHNNKLGAAGAAALATAVKESQTLLHLSMIPVGDIRRKRIDELKLKGKDVDDWHSIILCALLEGKSSITKLDVSCIGRGNVSIGSIGATAYAEVVCHPSSTLTHLDVSGNELGDAGATALLEALKNNTKLRVLVFDAHSVSASLVTRIEHIVHANFERAVQATHATFHVKKEWQPDQARINCTACKTQFTTTNRRHHCRICALLFCGDCRYAMFLFLSSSRILSAWHFFDC
jgi:hypothetical protein